MDQHSAKTAIAEMRRTAGADILKLVGDQAGATLDLEVSDRRAAQGEHDGNGVAEIFVELRLDGLVAD